MDDLANENISRLSVIKYHTWWPDGSDPFYLANIEENTDRTEYYGVDYVPHLWVDGTIDGGWQEEYFRGFIEDEEARSSPLLIRLDGVYHPTYRVGRVTVAVHAMEDAGSDPLKLRLALVESDIEHEGRTYNYVMRDMIPDTAGDEIVPEEGKTLLRSYLYSVDTDWPAQDCQIVAFVQNDDTKEVIQAARRDVRPDLRVSLLVEGEPVHIPPEGGNVATEITLVNRTDHAVDFQGWADITPVNGIPSVPLLGPVQLSIGAGVTWNVVVNIEIPGSLPAGRHFLAVSAGVYPLLPFDIDAVQVNKE